MLIIGQVVVPLQGMKFAIAKAPRYHCRMLVRPEMLNARRGTAKGNTAVENLIGFVVLCLICWLVWWVTPDSIKYPLLYDKEHVTVQSKLKNCDWGHAPIGDKGCHYKKHVDGVTNESGAVVGVNVWWEKVED